MKEHSTLFFGNIETDWRICAGTESNGSGVQDLFIVPLTAWMKSIELHSLVYHSQRTTISICGNIWWKVEFWKFKSIILLYIY